MATLAVATPRIYEAGYDEFVNELPIIASDTVYEGAAVGESGTSGTVRPLVSGDNFVGFCTEDCANESGAASAKRVKLREMGIIELTVTGVSAETQLGDSVYATDDNVFTLTVGGSRVGILLRWRTSTTALVFFVSNVRQQQHRKLEVLAKTADYTLTVNDSGRVFTTYGASGTVVFTAPPAVRGLNYRFVVGAAQELRIDPDGTETISLPGTGVAGAAGKYLTANAAGESVELVCVNNGTWAAFASQGTWTAEA